MPPTFFSDRSEAIAPELSLRLVAGLRKIGMLDAQGYVTADPRYTTQVRVLALKIFTLDCAYEYCARWMRRAT